MKGKAQPFVRAAMIVAGYFTLWIICDALSTYYYTGNYVGQSRASPWYLGVALTFYLIYAFGWKYAPAVIVVEWLRALIIGINPPVTVGVLTIFGIQQLLIYGGAAVLLRRVLRVRIPFVDLRDVLLFVVVAATAAPFIASLLGVLVFVYFGAVPWTDFLQQSAIFAAGDAIGFITLVPAMSFLLKPVLPPDLQPEPEPQEDRIGSFERFVLPVVLLGCATLGYRWLELGGGAPLYYFLFLPLVWMAARGGLRFAALGVAYADLSVVALDAYYRIPASSSLEYQSYIAASSLTALSLGALVTQRWRAERAYARVLEQQVAERTTQLNAALHRAELTNAELESFSYAVSHDLRAPLRAISGFTTTLAEDLAGKLDEQSARYFERISAAVTRMTDMIEALMALAHVTRTDLKPERVDLSALAREVTDELLVAYPGRAVELAIGEQIIASGDRRLLGNLLQNLFANALKFTSKQPESRVEFGLHEQDGKSVYFVKDDGVGFDMARAGRLFGAFQRMHAQDDFQGTGIGLATAHRIVRRHGGRIWADAEPGKGAQFSFTLDLE